MFRKRFIRRPILNINNNKVIDIYRVGKRSDDYDIALLMKYDINKFINNSVKYKNNIKLDLSRKYIGDKDLNSKLKNLDIK